MATTKNVTINAETISSLLDAHKDAASMLEKAEKAGSTNTDCYRASVIAIERVLNIIGIDWTDEEQVEEPTDERGAIYAEEFEALESKTRKTGYFLIDRNMHQYGVAETNKCECLGAGEVEMDWFLTRTEVRNPVIRVKWHFPTLASRQVYANGFVMRKKTWAVSTREQRFPFTEKGYEAACALFDSLMAE